MKMLVTGATGFIGKRVVEKLLGAGHDISCTVRETSDTSFLEETGVSILNCDLTDPVRTTGTIVRARPDMVFHCAARVWDDDEEQLFRVNAAGTANLCRACLESGTKKLVYLSSIAVVNGNSQVPLTDHMEYNANNAYGRSKIEAERAVMDYREKGLSSAVLRPCMVYGEDEPHALGRILQWVKRGVLPLPDTPGIYSRLNLVYVDNVVQAVELAYSSRASEEGTFIVADAEIITVKQFIELLYTYMGKGGPPVVPGWVMKPLMRVPAVRRTADRFFKDRVYDISRARDILGYLPETSTYEGLRRTVLHWRSKNFGGARFFEPGMSRDEGVS